MSAKQKLNAAYLLASLLVASFFGASTESLGVFVIALVLIVVVAYHARYLR